MVQIQSTIIQVHSTTIQIQDTIIQIQSTMVQIQNRFDVRSFNLFPTQSEMSLSSVPHVNFKKIPFHPVAFKDQGLSQ